MKIKKWVSAISALTIAASAFAGMAVTASATVSTPSVSEESDGTVVVTGIPAVLDTGCAIDDTTLLFRYRALQKDLLCHNRSV